MDGKQGIRRNFARRAGSYDRHAGVQRYMARGLLSLLEGLLPRSGLDHGDWLRHRLFTELLKQVSNGASLVALDLDACRESPPPFGAPPGSSWLVADGETLEPGPLRCHRGQCRLPVAHLPGRGPHGLLPPPLPRGTLAFSTFGPGNLPGVGGFPKAGRSRGAA